MRAILALLLILCVPATPAGAFLHGDLNDDKKITVDEVISVINGVLGCDWTCRQEPDCECQEYPLCGLSFCADTQDQFERCDKLVECAP